MNAAAYQALMQVESLHYVGPVSPTRIFRQKAISKLLRTVGSKGNYFFYSHERLKAIADEVGVRCSANASLDFFHGFTPWILTRPPRPYVAWSDCSFHDYVSIY